MSIALFTGGGWGIGEIALILFALLLLFGAKKLPALSRSLGKSLSEFKKGKEEGEKSLSAARNEVETLAEHQDKKTEEKKEEAGKNDE
ncbi:twin-arginine translocase TatA/TatE family subunit [Verrucomicrobiota bacterium]